MSKKTFNPVDWTETNKTESKTTSNNKPVQSTNPIPPLGGGQEGSSDIETITQRIESASVDIAPNYADWRDMGFALADELGESGRTYYHRLSRFYQDYNSTEADKQFDACLKAHGHGVSIKTFYHLAKSAGIDIAIKTQSNTIASLKENHNNQKNQTNQSSDIGNTEDLEDLEDLKDTNLPAFPDEIYTDLPGLLQNVVAKSNSPEDRDLLLLGSLVTISACLPNVFGVYAEREVFPNLFLFVTAQASAGKGILTLCRKLVEPIHKALREQNRAEFQAYQRDLTEYAAAKGDKLNMESHRNHRLKCL